MISLPDHDVMFLVHGLLFCLWQKPYNAFYNFYNYRHSQLNFSQNRKKLISPYVIDEG